MPITDDELTEKLARVGRRIQARAGTTRDELERVGLLQLAEEIRTTFGGRLTYLKTDRLTLGVDLPAGCTWTVYRRPKVRGRQED